MAAALQRYWDWHYKQNWAAIEEHTVRGIIAGRAFGKTSYLDEVFKFGPMDIEGEPTLYGFGVRPMTELEARLDKIPVPTTAASLDATLGDYKENEMFFALEGLPRAYMHIPTGFTHGGDYRMPPMLRVVYRVLAYRKKLAPGEDLAAVEAELVGCMWRDMLYVRKRMTDQLGDDTPVLFWRRRPTFEVHEDEGARARYAQIYLRLEVPGFDWNKYPVYSYIGSNSGDRPFPEPVSEERKEEVRLSNEVLRLSEKATQAANEHLNASHRLIAKRMQNMTATDLNTAEMKYKAPERHISPAFDPTTLYGAGVLGDPRVQEEQARVTSAYRAMIDSERIRSYPSTVGLGGCQSAAGSDGVALTSMAHPNQPQRDDLARIREQIDKLGG
jgi:hypothetical protein